MLCRSLEVVYLILDEGSDRVDELQCGGKLDNAFGGRSLSIGLSIRWDPHL